MPHFEFLSILHGQFLISRSHVLHNLRDVLSLWSVDVHLHTRLRNVITELCNVLLKKKNTKRCLWGKIPEILFKINSTRRDESEFKLIRKDLSVTREKDHFRNVYEQKVQP